MLFSLGDFRTKRNLCEERGYSEHGRFTVTDEMRIKATVLFSRGHYKVLVDGRKLGAKRSRTYVPVTVSLSFPGFTLVLTVARGGGRGQRRTRSKR